MVVDHRPGIQRIGLDMTESVTEPMAPRGKVKTGHLTSGKVKRRVTVKWKHSWFHPHAVSSQPLEDQRVILLAVADCASRPDIELVVSGHRPIAPVAIIGSPGRSESDFGRPVKYFLAADAGHLIHRKNIFKRSFGRDSMGCEFRRKTASACQQ
jgi:uncharacterized protein YwbE